MTDTIGSIIIRNDPVLDSAPFLLNISPMNTRGYADARFQKYTPMDRAEGGYWAVSFSIHARETILKELYENALGRIIEAWGYGLEADFEGRIEEIVLVLPPDRFTKGLRTMGNKAHMRADLDGDGEVDRSTVIEHDESQDLYGIAEGVMSGGQLASESVADQTIESLINLRALPKPSAQFGGETGIATIEIFVRGFVTTLEQRIYNQIVDTGYQSLSSQIVDVIGRRLRILLPTTWDQECDWEEGDTSDADTVSPAWDAEVNVEADFDAVVDADNDMSDQAAAAHDGATGLEFVFDDANAMYGTMNADAADQTSGVCSIWFNPNSVTLVNDLSKWLWFWGAYDGANDVKWALRLYKLGSDYRIYARWVDDATILQTAGFTTISAVYHHVLVFWGVSTGPGNDDGYMRVYIDGVLSIDSSGHDNDTWDWDYTRTGMMFTNAVGFGGSYYIDTIKIDPVGAPFASKLNALTGTYSLLIPIMDGTARYVEITDPVAEDKIQFELEFAQYLTMANGDYFRIAADTTDAVFLDLMFEGTNYLIRAGVTDDDAVEHYTTYTIFSPGDTVRVAWWAAPAADDDNGGVVLLMNGRQVGEVLGIDNDTMTAAEIRAGALAGIDAGTYGLIQIDTLRWSDESQSIVLETGVAQFIESLEVEANTTPVTQEYDMDRKASSIVMDLPRLGDSQANRWLLDVYGRSCTSVRGRRAKLHQAAPVLPPE